MWTIGQPFLLAEGGDWFRHLDNLLPIILVVLVGVLTLVKRGVEIVMKKKAAAASTRREERGEKEPPGPQKTVFEEMRKYFEILEGKPTAQKPSESAGTEGEERAPAGTPDYRFGPAPAPSLGQPGLDPMLDPATSTFHELDHRPTHVDPHGDPRLVNFEIYTRKPLSRPQIGRSAQRTGLPRIRLTRSPRQLRAAILWSEILGKPRHENPF